MPKLTKTIVTAAAPKASPFYVWCSELKGFGVRVWPTGRKVYVCDYYPREGTRKRMTLGEHGKLTTEEARKMAIVTLGDVLRGADPAEERSTRRKSMTVAELCDTYLEAAKKGLIIGKSGRPKKASTLDTDRGRVERHIKPLLGRKLVIDLQRADIARFVADVTAGKTATDVKTGKRGRAIVEGGAGTAARTTGLLGGILSYAVALGVIQHNPARGVKRPADNKRDRRLTPQEYRALGVALANAEREGVSLQAIAGAWLLALTGCRLGEVAKLQWEEVDLAGEALRLGDTKTGKSIRPLSTVALDVLRRIDLQAESPYVLASPRKAGSHFTSLGAAFERLCAAAGLSGVTAHTLRHSFASVGDDLGFTEATIGSVIGHATQSITGRYLHKLDGTLVAAANRIAGEVHRQMTTDE